jgi:D-glycero-alpha-D-manno-heptose-7-phosphate kinase
VVTKSNVPAGSGLGASSSLLIALSSGLNRLLGNKYSKDDLIQLGANLEAQSIRIPTGKQDYYPAAFGGINCLWFGIDHARVEPLELPPELLDQLNNRLLLTYTGEPRPSAASNWNMLKRYIERTGNTVQQMSAIKRTALAMREALLGGDLDRFARLLAEEWNNRKSLADGVTTPVVDRLVSEAERAGALASKICGAGGGGCMITFVRQGGRDAVIAALGKAGGRVLDFSLDNSGVQVRQSRA